MLLGVEDAPLKAKGKVAPKLPTAGSSNKVGSSSSSKHVLMMKKGVQEKFFTLPWKDYVSVYILCAYLFL